MQFFSGVVLQGSHEEGTLQWGWVVSNTLDIVGRQTHRHSRTESSGGFFLPRECSLGLWINLMKNKDSFIVLDTGQINVWGLKPSGQQDLLTPLYNQVLRSEYIKSSAGSCMESLVLCTALRGSRNYRKRSLAGRRSSGGRSVGTRPLSVPPSLRLGCHKFSFSVPEHVPAMAISLTYVPVLVLTITYVPSHDTQSHLCPQPWCSPSPQVNSQGTSLG